ncbi:molecular chaperone DnaJ [Natronospirillum operosum]|uniref:Molecular chaperone DnaJ n=1 Tax=Natronospirillum operosum TaxID=2759953 RepID=A0A4Z0WBQ5_9GAMM|nr:DnaJ domain-containing protein [Natronospirillum operosum]TGG90735.1 molecular chaperone DnaJ [Natronospirillum operosum]
MPLILFALLMAFAGWVYMRAQPPGQRRQALIKVLVACALVGVIFLALTGRLHLVFGLLAAMVPFLRRLLPAFLLGRIFRGGIPGGMGGGIPGMGGGRSQPKPGNQSKVTTDVLEMALDHDSGEMQGRVLQGPMEGRELVSLGESDFIELLQFCRQRDADSARLLETYLDKRFGDSWRADDPQQGAGAGQQEEQSGSASGGGPMNRREALDILGLEEDATRDDIVMAHRRLMQKLHPDRGGSDWLAARINEAKKILLD